MKKTRKNTPSVQPLRIPWIFLPSPYPLNGTFLSSLFFVSFHIRISLHLLSSRLGDIVSHMIFHSPGFFPTREAPPSIIAFLYRRQRILLNIPHLTRIDYFFSSSLIFVFLVFLETLLSCRMAVPGRDFLDRRLDVTIRFLFPLAFLSVILWFWQICPTYS